MSGDSARAGSGDAVVIQRYIGSTGGPRQPLVRRLSPRAPVIECAAPEGQIMPPFLARTLPSVLVALVSGWALAGSAAAQPKEVVIGIIYPMTGPTAQAGIDDKPRLQIAPDVANGAAV